MTGDPTAVLRRDLSRTARQRLTYVVRIVFVGGLLGLFLVQMATFGSAGVQLAEQALLARRLFSAASMIALGAVAVASPALLATTFVEEREQSTLDLLRLTRLSPWAVVLGALGARAVGVAGLLVALLPALSMLLPFGGIAVQEMFGLGVRAVLVGGLLGLVGGYVSLSARSVMAPLLASLGFAFFGLFLLPAIVLDFGMHGGELGEYASPLIPAEHPDSWAANLVLWAPAGLAGLAMTVARYRHQLLGRAHADDPAGRAEQRRWERWGTAVSALMLVSCGVAVGLPCLWIVAEWRGWWATTHWLPIAVWISTPLWFAAIYLWYLQVAGALVERFGDGLPLARLWGLKLPRGLLLPWQEASWIVRNPVVVRELTTRALGGLGLAAAVALGAWAAFGVTLALLDDFQLRSNQIVWLGSGGLVLLLVISLAAITQSVTDERRAGTFPLLLTTPFAPWRVVVGKLGALGVRFGWIALAIGLFGLLRLADAPVGICGWQLLVDGMLSVGASCAWIASMSAMALGVALVVRPAYLAWGVNLGLPVGWFVLYLAAKEEENDALRVVAFPFVASVWDHSGELAVAMAVHGSLTIAAIGVASVLLRKVAAREVGP